VASGSSEAAGISRCVLNLHGDFAMQSKTMSSTIQMGLVLAEASAARGPGREAQRSWGVPALPSMSGEFDNVTHSQLHPRSLEHAMTEDALTAEEAIKDPFVVEFLDLKDE
jgi:hypothetical protein